MIVFIQARSNSKRFDKKVLKMIYGLPLIIHVVNNVKKSKSVKDIIVATSNNSSDNNLIKLLKNFKIKFFRGELENVVLRFVRLAMKIKCKYFIRISGDSPLIDNKIIEYAAERNKNKYNLFTPGTNIKIISEALSRFYRPDYYLVLPWHFKKEILEREKLTRKKGTKFIFPLPDFKVI